MMPCDSNELPNTLVDSTGSLWCPAPEDYLRAHDRSRVRSARARKRPIGLMLLLAGPGVLVMLGENDGPSMLSYATTGATYGIGFFLPFILLTFVLAYVVQEMTVRVAIATHRGHAELIRDRFGPVWGFFAIADLTVGNLLTLVTEFVAIRAGTSYFGIPAPVAAGGAVILVVLTLATRRYATWERTVMLLALGNLVFIPAALLAHPDTEQIARALTTWGPLPAGGLMLFMTLVLANVGATVTPWMLFFQQSAVVDKGLTVKDLAQGRIDTALGAALAALVALSTVVAVAPLFAHHVNIAALNNGADFATALRPYLGAPVATLFALGMVEAGIVAAMTISTSSAYAVGEVLRTNHSLNSEFAHARWFFIAAAVSVGVAAAVTLVPGAPLLAIAIMVNVISTFLMLPALILLLLLANDREIMGTLANTLRQNVVAGSATVAIGAIGAVYGGILVARQLGVNL